MNYMYVVYDTWPCGLKAILCHQPTYTYNIIHLIAQDQAIVLQYFTHYPEYCSHNTRHIKTLSYSSCHQWQKPVATLFFVLQQGQDTVWAYPFFPIIGLYPHCLQSVSLTHAKMEEFVIWIPQTTTACVHRVLLDHAVQSNYVSYLSSQYPVVLPFSFGQWCCSELALKLLFVFETSYNHLQKIETICNALQ